MVVDVKDLLVVGRLPMEPAEFLTSPRRLHERDGGFGVWIIDLGQAQL